MKLKIVITILSLFLMTGNSQSQAIENTSYKNEAGERVLRIECTIPIKVSDAWKLFTNDEKLKKWIAPLAHIELKSGGYIITNYDSAKGLSDSSSIRLPILSFIDKELLVLKVNLNNNFVKQVRDNDQHLQEIIQFKEIDPTHTKIVSSMTGWGEGADWDKTYNFFARGNEWTYKELLKNYNSNY